MSSGSIGNCYLLENEDECLVLDAGVRMAAVKKALDFDISKIVGVCVSHSHNDHAKYISEFEKCGIDIFKPYENVYKVYGKYRQMGGFKIYPFELKHNVPCFGFYIQHQDIGTMIYATDTQYIKYKFKNLNHMIVECNYSKKYVDKESFKYWHEINDHMEQETCMRFVEENKTDSLRNVIFAHLSTSACREVEVMADAQKIVNCPIYVARKGLEIEL